MAGVQRWVLRDPGTGVAWIFPRNPTRADKLWTPKASITGVRAISGRTFYHSAPSSVREWAFEGVFVDAAHVNTMRFWMAKQDRILELTNHRGDVLDVIPLDLDDPEDVSTRGGALRPHQSPFTARFLLHNVRYAERVD